MNEPVKKARTRVSTLEIASYGSVLLAGAALFSYESGMLGQAFGNNAEKPAPAIVEKLPAAVTPEPRKDDTVVVVRAHPGKDADDIVAIIPPAVTVEPETKIAVEAKAELNPGTPAEAVATVVVGKPATVDNNPELPHARDAFELAKIPIPPEMPAELRAMRARHSEIARQLTKMGLPVPPAEIARAISYGADWTGADELYLNTLARAESTYRHGAHNKDGGGKGACGLFQFRVSSTYLEQIFIHAPKFPPAYQWMNGTIGQQVKRDKVTYFIRKGADAGAIIESCYDPKFSAVLAGFMSLDNREALENRVPLGRKPNFADMYILHFLGLNGGSRMLRAYANEDNHDLGVTRYATKKQRTANPGVFNRASTLGDFYDFFVEDKGMSTRTFRGTEGQYVAEFPPLPEKVPLPVKRPEPKPADFIPMGLRH
jgi:hypothetical protein